MVNALDAVFGVDPFERHHRHQHVGIGDQRRIASEQGFNVERARRFNNRVHPVAGNIDARHFIDDLVHLGYHDPLAEVGRFSDYRRVFGVKAGVEVAVFVGGKGGDQRDSRSEIDKVAAEQLKVGMDRPELDLTLLNKLREAAILRAGVGEVELFGNALLEQIEVRTERHGRLHHMQAGDFFRVHFAQAFGEKVRLLLVVALNIDAIKAADRCLQHRDGIFSINNLAIAEIRRQQLQALRRIILKLMPVVLFKHVFTPLFQQE